jgi:hypothetical protein
MMSPERRFELLRIKTGIFQIDDGKDSVGIRVDEDVGLAKIVVDENEGGVDLPRRAYTLSGLDRFICLCSLHSHQNIRYHRILIL